MSRRPMSTETVARIPRMVLKTVGHIETLVSLNQDYRHLDDEDGEYDSNVSTIVEILERIDWLREELRDLLKEAGNEDRARILAELDEKDEENTRLIESVKTEV